MPTYPTLKNQGSWKCTWKELHLTPLVSRNQDTSYIKTWPVPGVQIVERGRKIHEEKKNDGRLEGEKVYNVTRSPLTAALYYLNAWNRLIKTSYLLRKDDLSKDE